MSWLPKNPCRINKLNILGTKRQGHVTERYGPGLVSRDCAREWRTGHLRSLKPRVYDGGAVTILVPDAASDPFDTVTRCCHCVTIKWNKLFLAHRGFQMASDLRATYRIPSRHTESNRRRPLISSTTLDLFVFLYSSWSEVFTGWLHKANTIFAPRPVLFVFVFVLFFLWYFFVSPP